jgi:hypothetical protein
MDLAETSKNEYQEQGPKKGVVIIVITILLGTNGLLLWQFFDKKNSLDVANRTIVTTTAEKDALQMQLNQFKAEYEKLKSDNVNLQNQLSEKDEEIKAKVVEIQNLIRAGGPAQIARAKAELAKLKEMNDLYVSNIDSLNKITASLKIENQNLSTNLSTEKTKNENLSAENSRLFSKVEKGSRLKAVNITTEGLRYKGSGKSVVTNKAKQVQEIRTRFTLGENSVIDQGPIDVYLRVYNPDGSVMANNNKETFKSNGQDVVFTIKETVEYKNIDTPVELKWAKGSQFIKGKYNVEIFQAGMQIGKSEIDLK